MHHRVAGPRSLLAGRAIHICIKRTQINRAQTNGVNLVEYRIGTLERCAGRTRPMAIVDGNCQFRRAGTLRCTDRTVQIPGTDDVEGLEMFDDIAATLGGYVAEEMLFDDVTTGPSNDLMVITAMAREMVTRSGMSDKLGPVAFGERALGNEPYSEHVAMQIDAEVSKIIDTAKARAKKVITEHRKALDAIAKELTEKETIERSEFEKILIVNGITPKKREEEEGITIAPPAI